ncbi:MAG TPA: hypothetical protein PK867_26555 [Pirellulales bacterium]|nr:hypothetical protein [Pirellulales bacterium]
MATVQHAMAVGVFDKVRMAQQAVEELREAGFMEQQIGLVARSVEVTQIPAEPSKHDEKVSEGALGGILTGAGLGGLWAIGIEVELLPALGELILGGFLSTLFAGAIAGAAAGGIVGALIAVGLSRREAEHYEEAVKAGRIVVTVRSDDRYDEAIDILHANGAEIQSGAPLI